MQGWFRLWPLVFSLLPVGHAQQGSESPLPAPGAPGPIALDVAVTDQAGNPVQGLEKGDFTVLDNQQPARIGSFAEKGPGSGAAEVVLVVDAVNASFSAVSYERSELDKFLKAKEGQLAQPFSLAVFTDAGISIASQPTRDGNALAAALDADQTGLRTIRHSQGFYGAEDRLQLSIRALLQLTAYEAKRPGPKLVIWVGPGWPYLSGPGIESTNKQQQALFETIIELRNSMRAAQITLDSVDPLGTGDAAGFRTIYYKNFLKPVTKPSQVQLGNLALQVLSLESGGRVLNSNNDISAEVAACARAAAAGYLLTYQVPAAGQPGAYHAIQVQLSKPGLVARTRTGYYAPAGAAPSR